MSNKEKNTGFIKRLPKHGLTKKQHELLTIIKKFIAKNDYSPSYAELADAMGTFGANIHRYVHQLVDRGHITKTRGHRSIQLVKK